MRLTTSGLGSLAVVIALSGGCTMRHTLTDDAGVRVDAGPIDAPADLDTRELVDAPARDAAGAVCGCLPGPHTSNIYVLSQDAELYAYDPVLDTFTYVLGPVCAGVTRPFSMAVDPSGRAWILESTSRRLHVFDILSPGPCTDSGFLPTNPDFPLFGMGFVSPDAASECASLYVHSFSGAGRFSEGPNLGHFGVVEGTPLGVRELSRTNYDGAEVSGTGDGRVFSFGGEDPAKLTEYDRTTGAVLDTVPLTSLARTNANAFAFFAGDFYIFTEALATDTCSTCFETECAAAWATCDADMFCSDQIACAIEMGGVSDECGGGSGAEMLDCISRCSSSCLISPRARVSQVTRLDWDSSEGPGRTMTVVRTDAPIRIVGAGTSPCVPTVPF